MGSASHSSKRKKKRSQKIRKKRSKSIREKAKKLRRRHDLVSCSDDGDSASSSSVSLYDSSSEDDDRGEKRGTSCDRRGRKKGTKKQIKRDSSLSDSSDDSSRIKKRKRSKRNRDSDSRKKHRGKERRRERSSSYSSDRSIDDSKRELKKKEEKQVIKERDRKDKSREKIEKKRSGYNSRSCSTCSLRSEGHSYGIEERIIEEDPFPPRRLKSVIVVLREIEEVDVEESNRDVHKEEIVYEHGDYPTRSNDSNDGTSRGEALLSSPNTSDEKTIYIEDSNRETETSDVRTSEVNGTQRSDVERTGGVASSCEEFGVGGSNDQVSSVSVDLEAMLREKALQNLMKRQGKMPTKTDGSNNQAGHHVEVKIPDGGGTSEFTQKVGKNDDVRHTSTLARPLNVTMVSPPIKKPETGHPVVEKGSSSVNPVIGRPKFGLSTSTRRLLGSSNTWRRDPNSQGSPRPNVFSPKGTVNNDHTKGIESLSSDTEAVVEKAEIASDAVASELPASVGESAKGEANEIDEDSEFEQKTMTVMRGGELVQVSYKVKIPKKAPALARMQLKRSS